MNKTTVHWLVIGLALLASVACGAPRTEQANESEPSAEATETGQAENEVFDEDFETGNSEEWTESTPGEAADGEGTRVDPEVE